MGKGMLMRFAMTVPSNEGCRGTCETSWMSQYFLQLKNSSSQEFG